MAALPEAFAPVDYFESNYNRSPFLAQRLGQEFLDQVDNRPETGFGCYVILPESKFSNLGRFVEANVFWERFRNSSSTMHSQYGPYEGASEFYVVINQNKDQADYGLPVGVMRVIKPSEAGLKSLKDLKDLPIGFTEDEVVRYHEIDTARCADVGTLAVLANYRGGRDMLAPSIATYRMLFLRILNNPDYDHVINIIDKSAENGLKKFHFPFVPMCGEEEYFEYIDSGRSRGLVARTADFKPELTRVAPKLVKLLRENDVRSDSLRTWVAHKMFELVDPWMSPDSELDAAIALSQPEKMRDTWRP